MMETESQDRQGEVPLPMCSICHMDPPVNGIQLSCGHIFCYLCIKSASETTGVCAMCRMEIGDEFNFQEHQILGTIRLPASKDGFFWFYEGYRGWWLYDADTNNELELAHQQGRKQLEKFIAGGVYRIDLDLMIQRRKDDEHGRSRKMARARLNDLNILGIAGLKGRDSQLALEMMKEADEMNRRISLASVSTAS